jgi:hypothetical protein
VKTSLTRKVAGVTAVVVTAAAAYLLVPAPFVGGLLTTNTNGPFGGDTRPPGYTQASIATIPLWSERSSR